MSYKVLQRLSGGGFADVFEVEDTASALPERLILKRLSAEMSARPDVRAAFADEAKILRELKHPNVVTFRRCYFDEAQRVCLLMEKVAGEAIDSWTRRHPSQVQVVFDVFESVLQAVDYLHRRAVPFLHLDLKPDNILVASSPSGPQPVLIDFGIARRSGGKGLKAYTPPYGAPEQLAGGALGPATDVHALGQILLELLEVLTPLSPPVLEALRSVGVRATSPSQRARFPDAGEMGLAFRRARKALQTATVPPPLRRTGRFSGWRVGLASTGLAALIAGGAVWVTRPDAPPLVVEPESSAALRLKFDQFLQAARTATVQGRFDSADQSYQQAWVLWKSLPAYDEEAQRMENDLEALRNAIDLAHQGVPSDDAVLLDGR